MLIILIHNINYKEFLEGTSHLPWWGAPHRLRTPGIESFYNIMLLNDGGGSSRSFTTQLITQLDFFPCMDNFNFLTSGELLSFRYHGHSLLWSHFYKSKIYGNTAAQRSVSSTFKLWRMHTKTEQSEGPHCVMIASGTQLVQICNLDIYYVLFHCQIWYLLPFLKTLVQAHYCLLPWAKHSFHGLMFASFVVTNQLYLPSPSKQISVDCVFHVTDGWPWMQSWNA
jgi:hypothetical protein